MPPVAVAALLTLAALWGSAFPAIKLGLDGLGVPQFQVEAHRGSAAKKVCIESQGKERA